MQAAGAGAPVYRVKSESGPDHHKRFLVEVRVKGGAGERGKPLASGMGRTKKLAEQDAARRALESLDGAGSVGAPSDDNADDNAFEEPSIS